MKFNQGNKLELFMLIILIKYKLLIVNLLIYQHNKEEAYTY